MLPVSQKKKTQKKKKITQIFGSENVLLNISLLTNENTTCNLMVKKIGKLVKNEIQKTLHTQLLVGLFFFHAIQTNDAQPVSPVWNVMTAISVAQYHVAFAAIPPFL